MNNRKNIMACWKEFNPLVDRSIREDFQDTSSPFKQKIITYLNRGEVLLVSPECSIEVFSGEKICHTKCIYTDGEYSWSNSLVYYVQYFNLRLPEEFENKILTR